VRRRDDGLLSVRGPSVVAEATLIYSIMYLTLQKEMMQRTPKEGSV
jgi:hypothetical protein